MVYSMSISIWPLSDNESKPKKVNLQVCLTKPTFVVYRLALFDWKQRSDKRSFHWTIYTFFFIYEC